MRGIRARSGWSACRATPRPAGRRPPDADPRTTCRQGGTPRQYPGAAMGLQSFEHSVERMVDGVFARAFRSQIKPIELGRRLIREMDDHRSVDVRGRTVVPNAFTFYLSQKDLDGFADVHDALIRELSEA